MAMMRKRKCWLIIRRMRPYLLFLFLFSLTVSATELHGDGAVDTHIRLNRKWDVVLHSRARVRVTQDDWYDISLVPIFTYQAHRNVQFSTGTFFTRTETKSRWRNVARPFVAVEPSIRKGRVTLASRTGYERFVVFNGADYNRYRQRFRVVGNGSWKPYASTEFFLTNAGLATTRYGVGVRKDIGKHDGIEFFYWYEARDLAGTGVRHVLSVTLHLRFAGLAPDF
jgi:hypothetical protein